MPLGIEVLDLPAPRLEFGGGGEFSDPKVGLTHDGPFSLRFGSAHTDHVRLGLVGPPEALAQGVAWFTRCQQPISSGNANQVTYPDFPGFGAVFRATLELDPVWRRELDPERVERALKLSPEDRFRTMLDLYADEVERLANRDVRPNVTICCLTDEIVKQCRNVQKSLSADERRWAIRLARARAEGQMTMFDEPEDEETVEDLLYRDFRRALKARAMACRMPIQIGTPNLFVDGDTNQDSATRAWNVGVALFYKAGGIPWRLRTDGPETCFVGLSFHHLRTTRQHLVYSSLAQAFSTEGDGYALRGDAVPWDKDVDRRPHLNEEQAARLAGEVLKEYRERTGRSPARVVVHKTSKFDEAEVRGVRAALNEVPRVQLVNLMRSRFRLVHRGQYPPRRGTLCRVNGVGAYLFTTGYVPEWRTYPGPHIPVPLRLVTDEQDDELAAVAIDVLGLTRMNWNTARDTSGQPITLRFAREVGGIMAEVGPNGHPNPSYRYYM